VKESGLPRSHFKIVARFPGSNVQDLRAAHLMEDPKGPTLSHSGKIILLILLLGKSLLLVPLDVPGLNVPVSNIPLSIVQSPKISWVKMDNLIVPCSDFKNSKVPCSQVKNSKVPCSDSSNSSVPCLIFNNPSLLHSLDLLSGTPWKDLMDGDFFVMCITQDLEHSSIL
jgi:hypothetical protein